MGRTLHSRFSATGIVNHMAEEMRKKLSDAITSQSAKIAISVDEATTLRRKATLIIYTCT